MNEGMGSTRSTTFDCHWNSMESWIWTSCDALYISFFEM